MILEEEKIPSSSRQSQLTDTWSPNPQWYKLLLPNINLFTSSNRFDECKAELPVRTLLRCLFHLSSKLEQAFIVKDAPESEVTYTFLSFHFH